MVAFCGRSPAGQWGAWCLADIIVESGSGEGVVWFVGHTEPKLVVVVAAIVLVISDAHSQAGCWVYPTPVEPDFAPRSALVGEVTEG